MFTGFEGRDGVLLMIFEGEEVQNEVDVWMVYDVGGGCSDLLEVETLLAAVERIGGGIVEDSKAETSEEGVESWQVDGLGGLGGAQDAKPQDRGGHGGVEETQQ